MDQQFICDMCGRSIPPHAHYVVKIEVFADPSMPPVASEELAAMDIERTMAELLEQMKDLTAEDLQDQVHKAFEFRICRVCQMRFIANPLGKPRETTLGKN